MDAHIIGIDIAQFLLKHATRSEKERSAEIVETAPEPAMLEKLGGPESRR